MKAVCHHYCKDKELAEQSNNLCVECFNVIVTNYAERKPAQEHYLETLLMGLKPEPSEKLYAKALYMSHLDYCERIIQFYREVRQNGEPRDKTVKDRLPGDSRANINRARGRSYSRHNEKHISRNQTKKRDLVSAGY
jgi:hypothetical protein